MKLTNDIFFLIGLKLDLPDIFILCQTNKRIYRIYTKDYFWTEKLHRDFPNKDKLTKKFNSSKDYYVFLWKLLNLKQRLNISSDIYTIYSLQDINLNNQNLIELPKSIKILDNLVTLIVRNNKLKKLPNIFPPSLMYLDVSDNKLEELPDLLPSNLRILRAWNNHNLRKSSYNYPGVFVFM